MKKSNYIYVSVPDLYKNFKIVQYNVAGTYLMETDSTGLNHWKLNLPRGEYKIIGFTEDGGPDKNFALEKIK